MQLGKINGLRLRYLDATPPTANRPSGSLRVITQEEAVKLADAAENSHTTRGRGRTRKAFAKRLR